MPLKKHSVNEIDERFLDCRDLGHSWRHHDAVEDKKLRVWHRTVRCMTCNTFRHQHLDMNGYRLRAWYEYPKGYLIKGASFNVDDRARMRLLNIRRVIGISPK